MDTLLPIKLPPGFRNTGTVYQAKGRWYTGNFVRFFQDTIQPIGGWAAQTLTGAAIVGVPRAMVSYLRQTGAVATPVTVIGTTRGLYAIVSGTTYDITPAAITTTITGRTWQLDVFGNYLVAVDVAGANTPGRAYYWTGNTAAVAGNLDPFNNAIGPNNAWGIVATPERFLMTVGGPYSNTGALLVSGLPNPRVVMWATQEGGFTSGDWTPAVTNTAGALELATNGQVVCARRSRSQTLVWTTTDLWAMTYIGGEFVFRADQLGSGCGIIAPNAGVVLDTAVFWMGQNGFYAFDGTVRPLNCEVQDYVFGSLNTSYSHYIWALDNPLFGEVTWFYPHAGQTEITRYVTYSYRENHWVTGTLSRTCGVALQLGGSSIGPAMCNATGTVFSHETGTGRNAEGTPSVESGPVEIGEGDRLMQIQSVLPDDQAAGGTSPVNLTLFTAPNADTAETTLGPYTLAAKTTLRAKARQIRLKLSEVVASAWRVGVIRIGVIPSSRR